MKRRPSFYTWIICAILAAVIVALGHQAKPVPHDTTNVGGIAIGGPFTLTDHNGKTVTEKSWPGQYLLVYFGFTHCPDICPIGLAKMADALKQLPQNQMMKIQPLMITVDPERDIATDMKKYMALFDPRLIGLTGTKAQIEHVEKLYRVYAEKQGTGKDYMVNHSGFTYLMNPAGENVAIFAHEDSADKIAQQLKTVVR